jgi:hypothetical protein
MDTMNYDQVDILSCHLKQLEHHGEGHHTSGHKLLALRIKILRVVVHESVRRKLHLRLDWLDGLVGRFVC